jgi:hypothetical protein
MADEGVEVSLKLRSQVLLAGGRRDGNIYLDVAICWLRKKLKEDPRRPLNPLPFLREPGSGGRLQRNVRWRFVTDLSQCYTMAEDAEIGVLGQV